MLEQWDYYNGTKTTMLEQWDYYNGTKTIRLEQWDYNKGTKTIGLTFLTDSYEYSCQSHTNLPE